VSLQHFRNQLANELSVVRPIDVSPSRTDVFMASSVLQKALRRGDSRHAQSAAARLLKDDPARFWRRLVAIAFEDFGVTDLALTQEITAAAADKRWRMAVGGDQLVAWHLINKLLVRPRDRRVDECYMLSVSLSEHRDPEAATNGLGAFPPLVRLLNQTVAIVLRCEQKVAPGGHRALLAANCDRQLTGMASRCRSDAGLLAACRQARRTSRCLLPVLLPLLKGKTERLPRDPAVVSRPVPEMADIRGVPSYAIDGYTRPGRRALAALVGQDRQFRALLGRLKGSNRRLAALTNLLFAVEGGICTTELSDRLYDELKAHSIGCWSDLPQHEFHDGLAIMRDAIPSLNEIRAQIMENP
jgi:hypothetical protein